MPSSPITSPWLAGLARPQRPWKVSVRGMSSHSGPEVPPLSVQKPGPGLALQDKGLRGGTRPTRAIIHQDPSAGPRRRDTTQVNAAMMRAARGAGGKPSPGAAREGNPALRGEERRTRQEGGAEPQWRGLMEARILGGAHLLVPPGEPR